MYVRATPRKNKDGSVVRYLQLAHNVWDAEKKRSRAEVIYNFGREDAVSREALERLAGSLSRFLSAEPDPQATLFAGAGEGFDFLESRPLGGLYALDGLWQRLGIDAVMRRLLRGRRRDPVAERVLFALVASRALAGVPQLIRPIVHETGDVSREKARTCAETACIYAEKGSAELRRLRPPRASAR